jgi:DNA-binding NtrC family response regulator
MDCRGPPRYFTDMNGPVQRAWSEAPERGLAGIDCVFLTCFNAEFSFLALVLHYSGIRMHRADTLDAADFLLLVTSATAFLTDVAFLDGSWEDALRMATGTHPQTPAFVVADAADATCLKESYERGACGVLWKPLDIPDVIEAVRTAHQAAQDRKAVHAKPVRPGLAPASAPLR